MTMQIVLGDAQWAVAVIANRTFGVTGDQKLTHDQADVLARRYPTLTITGCHPDTGDWVTLTGVSPVVYRDLDYGWIFWENNWPMSEVATATANRT